MQLVRYLGLLPTFQGLPQATEDRSKPRFAKQPEIYLRSELGEANYTYPLLALVLYLIRLKDVCLSRLELWWTVKI